MATIDLSKKPKVILTKGAVVKLSKDGTEEGESLNKVFFGAKWGSIVKGGREVTVKPGFLGKLFGKKEETKTIGATVIDVDLDASLVLYDSNKRHTETVYFGHKESRDGSIKHSGDDLVGTRGSEKEMDNETITMKLKEINPSVKYVVAILNSFRNQPFNDIPYIKLRIYTGEAGKPDEILCEYNLKNDKSFNDKTAIVLGVFTRNDSGDWHFRADGTTTKERKISAMETGSALNAIEK